MSSTATKRRRERSPSADPDSGAGKVERTEHRRLVTGAGDFVADIVAEGCLHLGIVRSTIASGTIERIDATPALAVDGVVAAFTAADFGDALPTIPMRVVPVEAMQGCLQPVLASDRIRYVGEPVAFVVAESAAAAEDGIEAVQVEYSVRTPTMTYLDDGEPVWEHLVNDEYCAFDIEKGDAEHAITRADVVVKARFQVQRHTSLPLEPRGVLATWDESELHMWGPTKYVRFTRQVVAESLQLRPDQVICHHIDVGGMFGARGEVYPEDILVPWAALRLGRPVRWIEDRREHMLSINHSREHTCTYEVAATREGQLLAFRFTDAIDHGAYARPVGGRLTMLAAEAMPGPYVWQAYSGRALGHASNKTPAGTMRGPSGFEVNFIRERALDMVAAKLDMDPIELRRINLVPRSEMPYEVELGPTMESLTLDTGDYPSIYDDFLEQIDYKSMRSELEQRRLAGEIVGMGLATFLDHSGLGKSETATIDLEVGGRITLATTGSEIGQGIASMAQMVVAPILGLEPQDINVVTNDTARHDEGLGTYASRSTVFVGGALHEGAHRLKAEVSSKAAKLIGCSPEAVALDSRGATANGRTVTWAELAPMHVVGRHEAPEPTFGFGIHVAVVRVEPDTALVVPERVIVAYDCGRAIDREGVIGQLRGATVQGIGGALLEELAYDADGQPLSTSLADYMIPTATDVPAVEVHIFENELVPTNPLGVKGVGEAGILGVGAALGNALGDALRESGAQPVALPLKPDRVAELLSWLDPAAAEDDARELTRDRTQTSTVPVRATAKQLRQHSALVAGAALLALWLLRRWARR